MPGPFPGMDPYLEAHWRDIHATLVPYARAALNKQLPRDLKARVEERIVLEGTHDERYPDVRVVEAPFRKGTNRSGPTASLATTPLIVDLRRETATEGYLQVIDTGSGNKVVTVIEVLSPTNKFAGPSREEYLRKQDELCRSDTNLVEIDLLRAGKHTVAAPLASIPLDRRTPYLVCVRRATVPTKAEVYSISLQQALPVIKVPLRPDDQEVDLDLQALIAQAFEDGNYEGDFDYSKDPDGPLSKSDAAWIDRLLRDKGLRTTTPARRRRRPTSNH